MITDDINDIIIKTNKIRGKQNMKIYYGISTHWDREWYKQFQGFRYNLVKMFDNLIEALENDNIEVFTFDGQTVVLDDYLQIKPYNKNRIIQLIKRGKLKVGPWYVMPDELLVSGESLIMNFLFGKRISEEFGTEPYKYGYMNDIFGHIGQMPQLLSDMNIKSAYLGRGAGKESQNYTNFLWEAPDGSQCFAYKDRYADFKRAFDEDNLDTKGCINFLKDKCDLTENVIMLYTDDHMDIDKSAMRFEQIKNELKGSANTYDCTLCAGMEHIAKSVTEFKHILPKEKGELIFTAETENQFRSVTDSLSSYYSLKRENDLCQSLLKDKLSPILAAARISNIDFDMEFYRLAYEYLLKNQPHDSICGCSTAEVHEDMLYRYSQVYAISDAIISNIKNRMYKSLSESENNKINEISEFYTTVFNYDPIDFNGVFVTDIAFPINWSNKFTDNARYQQINGFDVTDKNGEKVEYQILKFTNSVIPETSPYDPPRDVYTVAIKGKLKAFGGTFFKITKGGKSYFRKKLADSELKAENRYIILQIESDGSITMTDKESGTVYKNLNTFTEEGEMGNGWFSDRPFNNNIIVSSISADTLIETIHNGALVKTFRITKNLIIPKSADYNRFARDNQYTDMKIITDVTLRADSKNLEFETTVYNNASDHKLRVEFPTMINSNCYYASQAFDFVKRPVGITPEGAGFYEQEAYEKNTSGIIIVKDANNNHGLSFIGKEGFHQCGVSNSGVITAVMLRCFGRIMFNENLKNDKAQLHGMHKFRYALSVETDFAKLCNEKKTVMNIFDSINTSDNHPVSELIKVKDNIVPSIIKPSENGKGIIIRFYNPTDEQQNAEILFGFNTQNTKRVNILEEYLSDITSNGNVLTVNLPPHKITTIYTEKKKTKSETK